MDASSHFITLFAGPHTRVKKEYKTRVFPSRVNVFPLNQAIDRPKLNKESKMNLHSVCVVLMIFSFTEANAVTPVKELDITKYLGLWYEVS